MPSSPDASRPLVGFFNVDKPPGVTSRTVTSRVRAALAAATGQKQRRVKVGHVGTLDPLATGVLVLGVGPATRLSDLLHEQPKAYRGTFQLGVRSPTLDTTGDELVRVAGTPPTLAALRAAAPDFVGAITQRPPAFSAKRVDGVRAYELARQGHFAELPPVSVTIESLDVVSSDDQTFAIDVRCSSGTYIRTLGVDLAAAVGSAAAMSALRRTRTGPFVVEEAASLETILTDPLGMLRPPLEMLRHLLPERVVTPDEATRLRNGQRLRLSEVDNPTTNGNRKPSRCVVSRDETAVAIAEFEGGTLRPTIVLERGTVAATAGGH